MQSYRDFLIANQNDSSSLGDFAKEILSSDNGYVQTPDDINEYMRLWNPSSVVTKYFQSAFMEYMNARKTIITIETLPWVIATVGDSFIQVDRLNETIDTYSYIVYVDNSDYDKHSETLFIGKQCLIDIESVKDYADKQSEV